jgi:primosomal protein N' (replication factor Y)
MAEPGPEPTAAQARAVSAVAAAAGFQAFVLRGVTGSGKTEVYIDLIERVVARGCQALVLIPEIGLTPQTLARLRGRLDARVVVSHSGLSDGERLEAWLAARDGTADIVIGTRSAVFIPLARPALIVVDEEHDPSLKQHEGFRYSARDLAVVRARRCGVPVVLGSATPSLETMLNVRRGRYVELVLPQRAGGAQPPAVRVVDLRGRRLVDGLSDSLCAAIEGVLGRGEQVLLFHNRRGFAPALLCHACGWLADCARCDTHMVLHREEDRLRCHHCAAERPVPDACGQCGAGELHPVGLGTQRVSESLAGRFPTARIARVDRDSTRRKGALEGVLGRVRAGEVDVLIGTQMLAKGHHFPNVTVVGILDADAGLFAADFRASERMAQLLVQVAGRAGRGERPGEVLIQTHHPDHPLLVALIESGYEAFCAAALEERNAALLPPFSAMALLRADAVDRGAGEAFLEAARLAGVSLGTPARLLGPVPAPLERRAGRHRWHLLLEADARPALQAMLEAWLPLLGSLPEARRVRWSLDVDPLDLS